MKKFYPALFAILFSLNAMAQEQFPARSVTLSLGHDQDMLLGIDGYDLLNIAKQDLTALDLPEGIMANYFSSGCDNPSLRITATFGLPGLSGTELQIGFVSIYDRIDAISYTLTEAFDDVPAHYLNIDAIGDEVALESNLLFRGRWKFLHGMAGLGTNIGYHYNNSVHVWESGMQSGDFRLMSREKLEGFIGESVNIYSEDNDGWEGVNGLSHRAYILAGGGFTLFKRLDIGLEIRHGLGQRIYFGRSHTFTRLRSSNFYLKFNF